MSANFGDDSSGNISIFDTEQVFMTFEDLLSWVQETGRMNRIVVVKQRSKKNVNDDVIKVFLKCDHGGEYKGTSLIRRSGTKRTNCPFQLVAKYFSDDSCWMLRVTCAEHNHELAQQLEGHPFAMRLTDNEKCMIEDLSRHNMETRDIVRSLREQNSQNVSTLRTIYNARQQMRKDDWSGYTPMHIMASASRARGSRRRARNPTPPGSPGSDQDLPDIIDPHPFLQFPRQASMTARYRPERVGRATLSAMCIAADFR
ncbi:hypothetical protein E3N88_20893 [Mikania micrantha]|uniref:FAR1 domain-containing protein n=1 Tax=Mikania micrantha TaxID=192012 RepID=A0A5N6NK05_9ASTR|nr:hypothetical protein E3N88_20893 [Mikania micrantha]